MSKTPDTVGEDIGISEAKEFMIENGYHHLPALSTGILTGIISYRDIEITSWDDQLRLSVQLIGANSL